MLYVMYRGWGAAIESDEVNATRKPSVATPHNPHSWVSTKFLHRFRTRRARSTVNEITYCGIELYQSV